MRLGTLRTDAGPRAVVLGDGDVVAVRVDGIGEIRNTFREARA